MQERIIKNKKVLVTGGAGFIGSNLCEELVRQDNKVVCLDNFSTGFKRNIEALFSKSNFTFIEGDIRNYDDCQRAVRGVEIVLHQAALGSVPRSMKDPMTTTDVNIGGFVKMLFAAKEEGVKRFVYAASSSTYGDHPDLPKVEDKVGNPLSPYAITKFANELYAQNFSKIYGIETIGLRYFNVFGRKQDSNGAYAAVIPKFVKLLMDHQSPVINGDGTHSRDFTYIDNVIQINQLAALTDNSQAINQVFNVACGENNNLNQMVDYLKEYLSLYDPQIKNVNVIHGPEREGDIKHSLASIEKAKNLLGYRPSHLFKDGLKVAVNWYWENLR
ncbi:MAG: Vi polysaccharide biosynthesis protein VipB/TviC [Bacteroidetes bacterium GWF2_33_16]|nr:MAG: Vi polysaccharide biosynthesis protein VipB/TviC [Bacteroidetes bacterium GWE2_32_14]OFY05973.1 MAG: Vi polysaccharide biosynthesis protein VipB/TviC [Bacteroidetes bacterium GWF2_33_16]